MFQLLRKRRQGATKDKPPVNRSPHAVSPKSGLFDVTSGDRIPCTRCEVLLDVGAQKTSTTISLKFAMTQSDKQFDVFFPLSECGRVEHFRCAILGRPILTGELFRQANDGRLIPSSDAAEYAKVEPPLPAAASSGSSGAPVQKRPAPTIYYYIARNVSPFATPENTDNNSKTAATLPDPSQSGTPAPSFRKGPSRASVVTVSFVVEVNNPVDSAGVISVPYVFTSAPRLPDAFSARFQMPENIRRIFSVNRSHGVFPVLQGKRADLRIDIDPDHPMKLEDYVYILKVELGEAITPQCADPVAVLILVTAIGMMVFFMLTRDLDDDY